MRESRRLLALAAVLCVTVGVGGAAAQTVIARGAPPGSTVELVQNETKTGSATAGSNGIATITGNLTASAGDKDEQIFVDVCGTLRRLLLVDRGQQPPQQGEGCVRREIAGYFLVRKATSLVVDVAAQPPVAWLRQGKAPSSWLAQEESVPERSWRLLPKGFVLFGGGGIAKDRDAVTAACGSSACTGGTVKPAFVGGASFWVTRYAAVEGSFLRPLNLTVDGSGSTSSFTSTFDVYAFTIGGQGGVPIGPVRVYGKGGANYHQSSITTAQTINDAIITVDGATETIPGGTQHFLMKTSGWGWQFGGGVEGWFTNHVGIYGEAMFLKLKGSSIDGGEGLIDHSVVYALGGIRIHFGR